MLEIKKITSRKRAFIDPLIAITEAKKILDEANLVGYVLGVADEDNNTTMSFKDRMPGIIGEQLALNTVKMIAGSLGKETQEMLRMFMQTTAAVEHAEELAKEIDQTKDKDRKEELEKELCELLGIDDIAELDLASTNSIM